MVEGGCAVQVKREGSATRVDARDPQPGHLPRWQLASSSPAESGSLSSKIEVIHSRSMKRMMH